MTVKIAFGFMEQEAGVVTLHDDYVSIDEKGHELTDTYNRLLRKTRNPIVSILAMRALYRGHSWSKIIERIA